MRSQIVAVFVVLLLFIMIMIPGLCFSLSSSVTSNNNQIQLPEDDQPFGLYKEASHDTKWTTPAFGKGVVQIKDNDGIKKITVAQDVLLSGTDKVYLWVPEDSEVSSLSVRISYHGDYFAIPSGSSIIFTFTDIGSTNTGSTISVGWGSSTSQNSVTVEGGHTYLVEVKISVRTSQNITLNVIPSIDITLDGGSDDVYNPNNNINFEEQLGGIKVESDGHVVTGPISSCPIQIDDGISYAIKDSSGHFTSNKNGSNLKHNFPK